MSKRLLCLSAHPDDNTLNSGGTIARFIDEGWEVWDIAFCASENIGQDVVTKSQQFKEFFAANATLGVHHPVTLDYPHRRLGEHRQEILDEMVRLGKDIKPNLVIIPSLHDTHQDHEVISKEGMRAFKKTRLWGFECIWNNFAFSSRTFVRLEKSHIETKVLAVVCYKSWSFKDYISAEFVWNLAKVRGVQIGVELAESFQCIREII